MDRTVLQKVSDRWNEYGFPGTSPVAGMINRLTRPEVKKAKPEAQKAKPEVKKAKPPVKKAKSGK